MLRFFFASEAHRRAHLGPFCSQLDSVESVLNQFLIDFRRIFRPRNHVQTVLLCLLTFDVVYTQSLILNTPQATVSKCDICKPQFSQFSQLFNWPTADHQQPTAESPQPTANSRQPTANSPQLTANSPQSTANSQQPTAHSQQPTGYSVEV